MSKNWSNHVYPKLKAKLKASARACEAEGHALIADAEYLAGDGRYERAVALLVLAEEELSKAFMLSSAAFQERWDSSLFSALTEHEKKQQIAAVMRVYIEQAWSFHRSLQNQFIPPPMPGPDAIDHDAMERALGQARQNTGERDRQKQRNLYTDINGNGAVDSRPNANRADYEDVRHEALKFKEIVRNSLRQLADDTE